MRNPVIVAITALSLGGAAIAGQAPNLAPAWRDAGAVSVAREDGIAVPHAAATLRKSETTDLGSAGDDLVAQYQSTDRATSGTIFLYRPSLPDPGLAFLATDHTVRVRFGPGTRIEDDRMVAVAGVAGAGRRVVYAGASENTRATAATFINAGSWIAVVRVSGPASRASEIKAAMDALVAGMRFPQGEEPIPANRIATSPCDAAAARSTAVLSKASDSEAIAVLVGLGPDAVDEKGHAVANPLRELPPALCLERAGELDRHAFLSYRANLDPGRGVAPVLIQMLGDAGVMAEVVRVRDSGHHYVLRHTIGPILLYGPFDRVPSDEQLASILNKGGSIPAVARMKKGKSDEVAIDCNQTIEGCKP